MASGNIEIIPLPNIPLISHGDDISSLLLRAVEKSSLELLDGDIIVIAHTVVSKAEGRVVEVQSIVVSDVAKRIAEENGFDPVQVDNMGFLHRIWFLTPEEIQLAKEEEKLLKKQNPQKKFSIPFFQ